MKSERKPIDPSTRENRVAIASGLTFGVLALFVLFGPHHLTGFVALAAIASLLLAGQARRLLVCPDCATPQLQRFAVSPPRCEHCGTQTIDPQE